MVQTVSGGGVGYNFTSMCKEASSAADLDAIMAKVPSYAQGFVALASAVCGAEDGQYLSLTGGGVQAQLAAPNPILQAMQVHIAVTAPAKPTGPPLSPYLSGQKQVLNPLLEGGTPGTLSPVVVAVAGLGIAYVLGWLKFLL
ncbi:MAG: hypothetical protein P4L84_25480 [Isosphaeraceae bacterium]|nr:hypothetical protein [Isosphaeraceae bacterium]